MFNAIKSIIDINKIISGFNPDKLFLCVDFDGTLSKICKNPYDAFLEKGHKEIIKKLSSQKDVYFCIVTGRQLNDIKKRAGIENNIIYSGNHGFEIKSYYKDLKFEFLVNNLNNYKLKLKEIENNIKKIGINNLIIENKKYSVSVHYRLLNNDEAKLLKKQTRIIIKSNNEYQKLFELKRGKKIIEIRPKIEWNKGSSCEYIVKKILIALDNSSAARAYSLFTNTHTHTHTNTNIFNILELNIGDDLTDETMFAKKHYSIQLNYNQFNILSINCVVGKKKSLADYYVDNYKETYTLLKNFIF